MARKSTEKADLAGTVTAVKARIRLRRAFDQISRAYQEGVEAP